MQNKSFRHKVKNILVQLNIPLTQNIRYDIYTRNIMKRVLKHDSCGIDIGCHEGEILDDMMHFAPAGKFYAFEPLPDLFKNLCRKYAEMPVVVSPIALFDKKGTTPFNYVENAPAYSGIRKRSYDIPDAHIREVTVETDLLDNVIPLDFPVRFIKIDVEGAEFAVLKGAIKILRRHRPVVIFECGLGAADFYGTVPKEVYSFLTADAGLKLNTLSGFLKKVPCLDSKTFCNLFENKEEYYFIAYSDELI
ncbi:MAG: FkbM family methyltransferase [Bacteroidota bacterium]|nr:FkbM family methyltransferase [Bacteroidota bacterium]